MNETPVQIPEPGRESGPEPGRAVNLAGRVTCAWKRVVDWIPPKARLATLTGALALVGVLIGLAIYASVSGGATTLNLVCRHDLQSAELSVSIDGKLSYTDHSSASPKTLLGIFKKRGVTFSKSLTLPSGEHVIEVHLRSATDGFDQTKQRELNLLPGKEATLLVAARRGEMLLEYEDTPSAPTENPTSNYSGSLRSILITLIGSAVSAAIGFFVQEFLRSRKSASRAEKLQA